MGLPSQKRTKSSKRRRASHFALSATALNTCTSCKAPVRPHHVCLQCGTYNGRTAVSVASKGDKKLRKREQARAKRDAKADENSPSA